MDTESPQKNFSFGKLRISGNTVIGTLDEGVNVNWQLMKQVSTWAQAYLDEGPWAYISNRVYSYSIDPLIYHQASDLEGLAGIAVVCTNEQQIRNFTIEKLYCRDIPLQHFRELEQAIDWCNTIIDERSRS